jgi:hypothetical protein
VMNQRELERERERDQRESPWGLGSRGWSRLCRWSPAMQCSAVEIVSEAQCRSGTVAVLPTAHNSHWSLGREVGREWARTLTGYRSSWPPPPLYVAARGPQPRWVGSPIKEPSQEPSWSTLSANW